MARCLRRAYQKCDDCHDDERRRREECVARCLRRAYQKSDDCHDDERREARRVRVSLFGESNAIEYVTTVTTMSTGGAKSACFVVWRKQCNRICDDCHDDERREARRVRVSLFEQPPWRQKGESA